MAAVREREQLVLVGSAVGEQRQINSIQVRTERRKSPRRRTMKRLILLTLAVCSTAAFGQSTTTANSGADAVGNANADSQSGVMTNQMGQAAQMQMGNITFGNSEAPDHQRVHTTPNVYTAPSMFGGSNNCGKSNTLGVGVTGFGIGGSMASESVACNAREDTATAYRLGYQEVAVVRFFCFGEEANRLAYEATGRTCPDVSLLASRSSGAVNSGVANDVETRPVQEPRVPKAAEPQAGSDTSRANPASGVEASTIVAAQFIDLKRDVFGNRVEAPTVATRSTILANARSKPSKSKVTAADSGPVGSISVTETTVPAVVAAADGAGDSPVMVVDVTDPAHATSSINPTQIIALAGMDTYQLVAVSAGADK